MPRNLDTGCLRRHIEHHTRDLFEVVNVVAVPWGQAISLHCYSSKLRNIANNLFARGQKALPFQQTDMPAFKRVAVARQFLLLWAFQELPEGSIWKT